MTNETPCVALMAGLGMSGDEQAKAKLRGIESDDVAVAFGPPT